MPQLYEKSVMTDGGAALLSRAQAGKIRIEFTRAVTGNGVYSAAEKTLEALQKRSALKAQKNSYPLSGVEILPDHIVKVTALVTNQDPVNNTVLVNEGYYINEIGLYAKEQGASEEIIFCITIAVETGDYMPAYNGNSPAQIVQDYLFTISNTANVAVDVQNGAVALAEDVNAIKKKTDKFTAIEAGYLSGATSPIQEQIDKIINTLATVKVPVALSCVEDNYIWYNDGRRIMQTYFGLELCAQAALIENIVPGEKYYVKTYCPNNLSDDSVLILGGRRGPDEHDGSKSVATITDTVELCDWKAGVNLYTFVGSNDINCIAISSFDKLICEIEVYRSFADMIRAEI